MALPRPHPPARLACTCAFTIRPHVCFVCGLPARPMYRLLPRARRIYAPFVLIYFSSPASRTSSTCSRRRTGLSHRRLLNADACHRAMSSRRAFSPSSADVSAARAVARADARAIFQAQRQSSCLSQTSVAFIACCVAGVASLFCSLPSRPALRPALCPSPLSPLFSLTLFLSYPISPRLLAPLRSPRMPLSCPMCVLCVSRLRSCRTCPVKCLKKKLFHSLGGSPFRCTVL